MSLLIPEALVSPHAAPPSQHALAQHVGGASLEGLQVCGPLGETLRKAVAHHGLEQFFLAGEIEKQGALGHASALGDLFGARAGEAFFDEQVERGGQQFTRTRVLAPLALVSGSLVGRAEQLGQNHPN